MKRFFLVIGGTLGLILLAISMSVVQGNAQSAGVIPLSKNFTGVITRTSAELTLSANVLCDQSQALIPDGSKLVTQIFNLNADANGVGTFQGVASVSLPDGRTILQGPLRGTVGINTRCGANQSCRSPWHLEGLFEGTSSFFDRSVSRSTTGINVPLMVLNFSADLNQQTASPLPVYQGRLDGLVPTLPALVAKVGLASGKSEYATNEPITVMVHNTAELALQTFDLKSFCSIVQLQIQNGNQWDNVGECLLKRMSFPVNIAAGQRVDIPLSPSQLTPGTYRLALTFQFLESGAPVSESFVVISPSFPVVAQLPATTVTVKADRDAYQDLDPVTIRVANEMTQTLVTADHKSYCSIVFVQKQEGSNWNNVAPCPLLSPVRLVKINPGQESLIKIANEDVTSKLSSGIYRAELTYWITDGNGQPTGNPVTIYGATFTVMPKR